MEKKVKKLPKERKIAKKIIGNSMYQKKKTKAKFPNRFDIWEDSVVGGLHVFEWIVIGLVSVVVFWIVALSVTSFAGRPPYGNEKPTQLQVPISSEQIISK